MIIDSIEWLAKDFIFSEGGSAAPQAAAPLYRRLRRLHFFFIESLLNLCMTGRLLHFLFFFTLYLFDCILTEITCCQLVQADFCFCPIYYFIVY